MLYTGLQIGDAGLLALLGYAIVFFGLILLMIVVMIIGRCFITSKNNKKANEPAPAAIKTEEPPKPTAPGSAGDVKLYNVEPRTAAMLMAIVADKLGKPLNELRFISIKEVE